MHACKRPRFTLKHGQTMEGAREVVNTSGQRHVSGIVKIRLNVRRTSLAQKKKKAMNTLLGQRKMTKKELHKITKTC